MANQNIPVIQQKGGNVGIGTISPSAKLHVSGADTILRNAYIGEVSTYGSENAQFSHILRAGAGEYSFLSANDGTTFINAKTGYEIRFRVNNSDKIVMNSNGNLGIGTTSPGVYKLNVNGESVFQDHVTVNSAKYIFTNNIGANSTSANLVIAGPSNAHIVLTTSNVGINTTSPVAKLHVVTDATANRQNMANITRTGGNWVRFTNPQYSTLASMGLILRVFPDSDARQGAGIIASGGNNNATTDLDIFVTTSPDGLGGTSYSAIRIDGLSGNVGIGTTTPGVRLDVNIGTTKTDTTLYGYGAFQLKTNESSNFSSLGVNFIGAATQTNRGFQFQTGESGVANDGIITFQAYGGCVGIGTTTPNYKLDVSGVINATDYFFNSTSTQRVARRYVSTADLSSAGYTVIGTVTGGNLASAVRITLQGTAGNTVINVTADILVNHFQDILITSQAGIYTTVTLRVKSDNNENFSIEATTNSAFTCTTNVEIYPLNSETVSFGGSAQAGSSLTHTCRPGINISATGGSDGNFAASGDGYFGGSLGLGAFPGNKLDIYTTTGAGGFNNGISIRTEPGTYTSGHGGMLQFQNEDVITAGIRGIRTTGWGSGMAFYVHNESAGNTFGTTFVERIRINEQGNVGIGTTTPAYLLDVSGTIRATGDVIAYSDARVKENVKTIDAPLEIVKGLRGVTYTRKDTDDKSEKVGVIAQEVLPILPQVVDKDNDGNYSVAYGNMVGVLIEAIKEQQRQIDELKYLLQTQNK